MSEVAMTILQPYSVSKSETVSQLINDINTKPKNQE